MGIFTTRNRLFLMVSLSICFTIVMYFLFLYLLDQPGILAIEISSEEAYLIILYNIYNYSTDRITELDIDSLQNNFTSQYVLVKGDGSVYQLNKSDREILNQSGFTDSPISGGWHYSWEILVNNTKFYVDSTTGQIISHSEF